MKPRTTLARTTSPDGTELELIEHAGAYIINADGLLLMSTKMVYSEEELARLACERLGPEPRVLIGGLGCGYTLRRTLDALPEDGTAVQAELVPAIVDWNREHLADFAQRPLEDPRTELVVRDVSAVILSIPGKYADRLSPWPLHEAVPYDKKYLAGFQAETYRLNLSQGFGRAKQLMTPAIRQTIRRDIGGDEQRISSMDTKYYQVTFKHLLLPVWISTYRYKGKPYTFLINGRTGEVQGDRPYSRWKIAGVVLLGLAGVAAIVAFFLMAR